MPFQDNNTAVGIPPTSPIEQGISNFDDNLLVEDGILIPSVPDPVGSYVYYDCTVGVMLDSGMVVYNRLPQVNNAADTIAAALFSSPNLDQITGPGVNITCQDQYQDILQRMGHARYWFRLWGQALRIGYQVPIPAIKTVGGVPVVPYDKNPQWGFNRIFPGGNYGGLILWHAQWSLWYTTLVPPVNQSIPAADLQGHVLGTQQQPQDGIQSPWSQADDEATTQRTLSGAILPGIRVS